jgi:hypothetical protein
MNLSIKINLNKFDATTLVETKFDETTLHEMTMKLHWSKLNSMKLHCMKLRYIVAKAEAYCGETAINHLEPPTHPKELKKTFLNAFCPFSFSLFLLLILIVMYVLLCGEERKSQ